MGRLCSAPQDSSASAPKQKRRIIKVCTLVLQKPGTVGLICETRYKDKVACL